MVMDLKFKGFMAPVFTPFSRKSGEVDTSCIKKYAEFLVQEGVNGVLVNGTVGEGICMSVQERKMVLEAWLDATRGTPLHVMVQIGGLSLRDVQELASHAESKGIDSILCLCDLFHRPNDVPELVHYLKLVSRAAPSTPLLYYHIPSCTGINLNMEEFLKAGKSEIPTLAGLKFTHNNLEEGSQCLSLDDKKFTVLLGNDYLISAGFFVGFDSLIATTLNFSAHLITSMHKGVNSSQVAKVQEQQRQLIQVIDTITKYGKWVPTMKEAMRIITGFDFGKAREPQGALTDVQVDQLKADLAKLKLANY